LCDASRARRVDNFADLWTLVYLRQTGNDACKTEHATRGAAPLTLIVLVSVAPTLLGDRDRLIEVCLGNLFLLGHVMILLLVVCHRWH
jgi:hypothetical protein